MMRSSNEEKAPAHGGEAHHLEAQDLSSETYSSAKAVEESERALPLLIQSETHAAS